MATLTPNCDACPLASKRSRKLVKTQRGLLGGVFVIGEQPGENEAAKGVPFVGVSGNLFDRLLAEVGIPRHECFVGNAIGCYVKGWQVSKTSPQQAEAAWRACQARLWSEVEAASPSVILCLGSTALQALFDQPAWKVTRFRGALLEYDEADRDRPEGHALGIRYRGQGVPATVSMHPASILRGTGHELAVLRDDLERVARWARSGPDPVRVSYTLDPTAEQLAAAARVWKERGWVCIDVEGPSRNRWLMPLRCIGLGDETSAVVVPWGQESLLTLDQQRARLRVLLEVWTDPSIVKVGHNFILFDQPVLERPEHLGVPMGGLAHDTMVAHHSFNMVGVRHTLQYVATRWLDTEAWKTAFEQNFRAPMPELAEYNAGDVVLTAALWLALARILQARQVERPYYHDLGVAQVALHLARNGMHIDKERLLEMIRAYRSDRAVAWAEALHHSGAQERQEHLVRSWAASGLAPWTDAKIDLVASLGPPPVEALAEALEATRHQALVKDDRRKLASAAEDIEAVARAGVRWDFGPKPHRPRKPQKAKAKPPEVYKAEVETYEADLREWESLDLAWRARRSGVGQAAQKVRSAVNYLSRAIYHDPFFAISSDQQIGLVLHEWMGLPAKYPLTKNEDYQVNEDAIAHLRGHPFVVAVQRWKGIEYRLGRCEELLRVSGYPDGRAHPLYKMHIVPSGRFSCGDASTSADPMEAQNFQNLDEELMAAFVVPEPRRLVGADYSAAEPRVNGVLSGCTTLMDQMRAFDEGRAPKIYVQVARRFWPDYDARPQGERDKLYHYAKQAVLMSSYGGGPKALFDKLRPTLNVEGLTPPEIDALEAQLAAECRDTQNKLKLLWPEVFAFSERNYRHALNHGWLQTCYLTGRRVSFPVHDRRHVKSTDCANLPIQTTARAICAQAEWRLVQRLPPSCLLVADTHDSCLVECPAHLAEQVAQLMREVMPYYLDGPIGGLWIPAEPKIGRAWLEVK